MADVPLSNKIPSVSMYIRVPIINKKWQHAFRPAIRCRIRRQVLLRADLAPVQGDDDPGQEDNTYIHVYLEYVVWVLIEYLVWVRTYAYRSYTKMTARTSAYRSYTKNDNTRSLYLQYVHPRSDHTSYSTYIHVYLEYVIWVLIVPSVSTYIRVPIIHKNDSTRSIYFSVRTSTYT